MRDKLKSLRSLVTPQVVLFLVMISVFLKMMVAHLIESWPGYLEEGGLTPSHVRLVSWAAVLLWVGGALAILAALKLRVEVRRIFICFYLVAGCFYMLFLPLSSVADEYNHFKRSYEISTGHLIAEPNPENGWGGRVCPAGKHKRYRDAVPVGCF